MARLKLHIYTLQCGLAAWDPGMLGSVLPPHCAVSAALCWWMCQLQIPMRKISLTGLLWRPPLCPWERPQDRGHAQQEFTLPYQQIL